MAQPVSVLGIDIAKLVFHVVGMNDPGAVVLRKRIACSAWLTFIANLPPLPVGWKPVGVPITVICSRKALAFKPGMNGCSCVSRIVLPLDSPRPLGM
jgi:hypothetical protein